MWCLHKPNINYYARYFIFIGLAYYRSTFIYFVFTARAMLCAVYAMALRLWVCLCLCVCVSDTSRSSTKMAKHRNMQTTPHDIPVTLVFRCQKSFRNSNGVTPKGAPNTGGVGRSWRISTNNLLYLENSTLNDLGWPLTTPNYPMFDILQRLLYRHNRWR